MNFRSVMLTVQLPDSTTETDAKALEEKLVAFATAENLSGTVSFDTFASFGTPPTPAAAPAKK